MNPDDATYLLSLLKTHANHVVILFVTQRNSFILLNLDMETGLRILGYIEILLHN